MVCPRQRQIVIQHDRARRSRCDRPARPRCRRPAPQRRPNRRNALLGLQAIIDNEIGDDDPMPSRRWSRLLGVGVEHCPMMPNCVQGVNLRACRTRSVAFRSAKVGIGGKTTSALPSWGRLPTCLFSRKTRTNGRLATCPTELILPPIQSATFAERKATFPGKSSYHGIATPTTRLFHRIHPGIFQQLRHKKRWEA